MADPSTCLPLTRESVQAAHAVIAPHVHRTPLLRCAALDKIASTPRTLDGLARTQWADQTPTRPKIRFWFKCENLQRVGAFKARGAFYAIERLKSEPGFKEAGGFEKGVAAHSTGNHAQALSWAAQLSGMPAYIIMPKNSNQTKVAATRSYGANVIFSPPKSQEREAKCAEVISETGARLVHPYDHPDIILGQGTVGLEVQDQFKELSGASDSEPSLPDAILVPCGGGGLLSGISLTCEGTPIRVFGTEPNMSGANDVQKGFAAGKRIEFVSSRTVADGLRTPMGVLNWDVCYERKLVKGVYSVAEREIMATVQLVFERMKLVVEPSAVVPLAVALFDEDFRGMVEQEGGEQGWDIVVVFSGGNVDLSLMASQLSLADEVKL